MRIEKTSVALALVAVASCYNPKPDIERFRPQAEKKLAAMASAGRNAQQLPPITRDALTFAEPSKLRFMQNVEVVHIEELSDIGSTHIFDRVVSNVDFWGVPLMLMKGGRARGKKPWVEAAFQRLINLEYLVIIRTRYYKRADTADKKTFQPGSYSGEAVLCEIVEGRTCYGGFRFDADSSSEVKAYVSGDKRTQERDRYRAVRGDLEKRAQAAFRGKLKQYLPGATFPSYW
jgi:hypothetical protein